MPLTSYNPATTPGDLVLGAGIIEYESAPTVWTKVGATRGAPRFNPGEEWRQPEIDGLAAPMAGIDRVVFVDATIDFTLIQWDAAILEILRPGATSVTAAGVTTITPQEPGTYIAAADLVGWRGTWQKGDTEFYRVVFPKALPRIGGAGAADRAEGDMPITLHARAEAVDEYPFVETFSAT